MSDRLKKTSVVVKQFYWKQEFFQKQLLMILPNQEDAEMFARRPSVVFSGPSLIFQHFINEYLFLEILGIDFASAQC